MLSGQVFLSRSALTCYVIRVCVWAVSFGAIDLRGLQIEHEQPQYLPLYTPMVVCQSVLGFIMLIFGFKTWKNLKKPTIKYHHTSSFFTGTTYIVVKVDGATPKRWWFVRGHDKPIHGELRQLLSRWYNFYHNQHQLQRWTVMPTASCYGVAPAWAMRNELVACGVPGL